MAIDLQVSLHDGQLEVWNALQRFQLIAAGRRWGKTWLGAARCLAVALRGGRAWWVSPTYRMAHVGWRGLNEMRRQLIGHIDIEQRIADRALLFANGGEVWVKSADHPDGLRGEGLNLAVLDECAYMKDAAWSEALRPALSDRKGAALFISTPHGLNWFHELWKRGQDNAFPDWKSWSFKTGDNPYIDADEIEAARATMLSRIFRQEYEADFLADNPGALWKRDWIDRVIETPDFHRVAVAVDPTGSVGGDECGIIGGGVARMNGVDHMYVLEDASLHGTPDVWARAAVTMYHKLGADVLVAEQNYGGEMVERVLQIEDPDVRVELVHASRGKQVRAEPISVFYQKGRCHHVGFFLCLEDELCQWEPGNSSPNRLDALVWLGTELLGKPRSPSMRDVMADDTTVPSMWDPFGELTMQGAR